MSSVNPANTSLSDLCATQAGLLPSMPQSMPRAAQLVHQLLLRLREGSLSVTWPNHTTVQYGHGQPHASLHLHDWQMCKAVLQSGDIGLAESYIKRQWETPDLEAVIDVGIRNRHALETAIYGSWWGGLAYRLRHWLNRNSKAGSKKNIHAHYDLGNDFYRLWLDASMTYSSALFEGNQQQSLEAAQTAKYQRLLDELQLPAAAKVLEIGCGWGGFAELAATQADVEVTGLTLSIEQAKWALARLTRAGVAARCQIKLQDYRDEGLQQPAQYEGIASIEMFEAVGEAYWPSYFDCIKRNLAPQGKAVVQSIVIAETMFERYRKGSDFIQQYIFPGGMLPAVSAFEKAAEKAGLQVVRQLAFGQDYAHTLRLWLQSFEHQMEAIKTLGFDERFIRTWRFYLCYCAAAFANGNCDVVQFTLQHAGVSSSCGL